MNKCATEGCFRLPEHEFEVDSIRSEYCSSCYKKIKLEQTREKIREQLQADPHCYD